MSFEIFNASSIPCSTYPALLLSKVHPFFVHLLSPFNHSFLSVVHPSHISVSLLLSIPSPSPSPQSLGDFSSYLSVPLVLSPRLFVPRITITRAQKLCVQLTPPLLPHKDTLRCGDFSRGIAIKYLGTLTPPYCPTLFLGIPTV